MAELIRSFRDLRVYQEMFALQQDIFEATKRWPSEEKFALTDQVRRSSRSMGSNVSEAWAKRRYPAHFVSKLTDADGEVQETSHWLASAAACKYLQPVQQSEFQTRLESIGRKLGKMISKPEAFAPRS
jgi:four helix bundle protein